MIGCDLDHELTEAKINVKIYIELQNQTGSEHFLWKLLYLYIFSSWVPI